MSGLASQICPNPSWPERQELLWLVWPKAVALHKRDRDRVLHVLVAFVQATVDELKKSPGYVLSTISNARTVRRSRSAMRRWIRSSPS
jgi:hypothetical protein